MGGGRDKTMVTCHISSLHAHWLDMPRNSPASTPLLCWLSVADCKEPPELEHGFVTFSSRNNLTTYRAAIQYHCQHPYYHMAPNSTGEQCPHGTVRVGVWPRIRVFTSVGSLGWPLWASLQAAGCGCSLHTSYPASALARLDASCSAVR